MNAPPLSPVPIDSSASSSSRLKRSRSCSPVSSRKRSRSQAQASAGKPHGEVRFVFLELFAGTGHLTDHVTKIVETLPPQDHHSLGGVDFLDDEAVQGLWTSWQSLHDSGARLLFHVAPPCSTFSRARDRNARTKLRSSAYPGGLYPSDQATKEGNHIALNTARSVNFLVNRLGASGTWEQPVGSYMFPFLDSIDALEVEPSDQVMLHQCKFGRPYKKPTVFACFGDIRLPSLDRRCTKSSPCSRNYHVTLGFGSASTSAAAAYPPALCVAYAVDLANFVRKQHRVLHTLAVSKASIHTEGIVTRHSDRGLSEKSLRAGRDAEDAASRAGARTAKTGVNTS